MTGSGVAPLPSVAPVLFSAAGPVGVPLAVAAAVVAVVVSWDGVLVTAAVSLGAAAAAEPSSLAAVVALAVRCWLALSSSSCGNIGKPLNSIWNGLRRFVKSQVAGEVHGKDEWYESTKEATEGVGQGKRERGRKRKREEKFKEREMGKKRKK